MESSQPTVHKQNRHHHIYATNVQVVATFMLWYQSVLLLALAHYNVVLRQIFHDFTNFQTFCIFLGISLTILEFPPDFSMCQVFPVRLTSLCHLWIPRSVYFTFFYEILVDSTIATRRIGAQKFSYLQFASSAYNVASEVMEKLFLYKFSTDMNDTVVLFSFSQK